MASSNGATAGNGHNTSRQPVGPRRPIVPAIPYAYMPKNRRQPDPTNVPSLSSEQPTRDEPSETSLPTTSKPDQGVSESDIVEQPTILTVQEASSSTADSDTAQASAIEASTPSPPAHAEPVTNGQLATPPYDELSKKALDTPVAQSSNVHNGPPAASPTPTRRRPGPSFQALNGMRQAVPAVVSPVAPAYIHTGHHIYQPKPHQSQPSNGSMISGGFSDSNRSSPGLSGAGFRPLAVMAYAPEPTAAAATPGGFDQPFETSPGFDGYPPTVFQQPPFQHSHHHHGHQGPSTPHSVTGSQSSVHTEENGYAHYSTTNGHAGHLPPAGIQTHRHMAAMQLGSHSDLHHPPAGRTYAQVQADTLLQFLQNGCEQADFADCTLEIHIDNNRRPRQDPVVIHCHRFIISRSPKLNTSLRLEEVPAGGRLILHVPGDYVRSDSFRYTLRTLYGLDLPDGPFHPYHPQQPMEESFDIALGYVAAASYLQLPAAHTKALHHACLLLHWETIEKACHFALPGVIFDRPLRSGRHNPAEDLIPHALIDAIINFLVLNMPTHLTIDMNAGDSTISRLPRTSSVSASSRTVPVVANGTSGHRQEAAHDHPAQGSQPYLPRSQRASANPRLSAIQFGDLSINGSTGGTGNSGDANRSRSPSPENSILSRILLELPFPLLKHILEHPGLAKHAGGLDPASRAKLISTIVTEREARRMSVLNGSDPQLQDLVRALKTAHRPLQVYQVEDFYVNNMGFKEEFVLGDVPYLIHTWTNGSHAVAS